MMLERKNNNLNCFDISVSHYCHFFSSSCHLQIFHKQAGVTSLETPDNINKRIFNPNVPYARKMQLTSNRLTWRSAGIHGCIILTVLFSHSKSSINKYIYK